MKKTALILGSLMLVSTAALADTVYDNTGSVGNIRADAFGSPNTTSYGETFSAPSDSTLLSFSLFLDQGSASGSLQGYVGTWTGTGVGSILYSSSLTSVTGSAQEFSFAPDISVTSGQEYVAFISIDGTEYSSFSGTSDMPLTGAGTIPGGGFVFQNSTGSASSLTGAPWDTVLASSYNAEFKADFGSVAATPEPSSLALLGTGVLGVAGMIRRRIRG